jgi:hypothetical protein
MEINGPVGPSFLQGKIGSRINGMDFSLNNRNLTTILDPPKFE